MSAKGDKKEGLFIEIDEEISSAALHEKGFLQKQGNELAQALTWVLPEGTLMALWKNLNELYGRE